MCGVCACISCCVGVETSSPNLCLVAVWWPVCCKPPSSEIYGRCHFLPRHLLAFLHNVPLLTNTRMFPLRSFLAYSSCSGPNSSAIILLPCLVADALLYHSLLSNAGGRRTHQSSEQAVEGRCVQAVRLDGTPGGPGSGESRQGRPQGIDNNNRPSVSVSLSWSKNSAELKGERMLKELNFFVFNHPCLMCPPFCHVTSDSGPFLQGGTT